MRLSSQVEIMAGGPGSGRHKETTPFDPSGKAWKLEDGRHVELTKGKTSHRVEVYDKNLKLFGSKKFPATTPAKEEDGALISAYLKRNFGIDHDIDAGGFGSSLIGRKNWVVSTRYGNSPAAKFPLKQDGRITSGPYGNVEEAEKASQGMPYTKVASQPRLEETPAVRDIVRRRMVSVNPDIDG